jgi:hypothetical protein
VPPRGWICLCWLWCLGCAGDLKDPERFEFVLNRDAGDEPDTGTAHKGDACVPPTVTDCLSALFKAKCNTSACHGPGAPQVDLVSSGVEARVIGQPSSDTGLCMGRTLVASDGSASLLADKVSDTPPCGSKMPLGGSLTDTEHSCLTAWVSSVNCGKE